MWLKVPGCTSGSMFFKQNVVYLVDQELPGLRSRHPVIKNLVAETARLKSLHKDLRDDIKMVFDYVSI
jgi:hypothetical protein